MSKIATLKKKAADLEKKSPEKAIAVYVELLGEMEKYPEEMDVALYNRVGDLVAKQGNVSDAVTYYEKAVDLYVDGGFFNNAIALCNKILRSSPGRATVYYKLGKISAHKGFKADAKQNFLEYADRMQKSGNMDEAFRALAEFADLCPDQTDIRLMLADQLSKAGKKDQAIEQLQVLYAQLEAEGNSTEAEATAGRIRALDPNAELRASGEQRSADTSGDLVFLDLGDSPKAAQQRRSIMKRATQGLKVIEPGFEDPKPKPTPKAVEPQPAPTPPAARAEPPAVAPEPVLEMPPATVDMPQESSLLGLESTSMSDLGGAGLDTGGIQLESTSLVEPEPEAPAGEQSLEFIMPDSAESMTSAAPTADLPMIDGAMDLELDSGGAAPATPQAPEASAEIPLLDVGIDMPSEPPAKSIDVLQAIVEKDPSDWAAHRELAEALLESGNREAGLRELEAAMLGFERGDDLGSAMSVVDEIVRIDPSSVKHHQKRVEYAYRSSDRPLLVEAYLALADALFRQGQIDKSRTIYQRVLELSPDDVRAQAAISTMPEPVPEPVPDRKSAGGKKPGAAPPPVPLEAVKPTPVGDDSFVNLGDWLREDEGPKDTRMVVAEEEPTGNEEADFADMLRKFKQGVAENVEDEDYQSHYDLGVAYKEMGLVDEAIAEFQKALRGPQNRVRTYEAIGQCFIEKGQNQMAATILSRALGEKGQTDDQLVGVLYLLGRANEALGKHDDALQFYQRVFVVDIQFQDVADRLNALENAAR